MSLPAISEGLKTEYSDRMEKDASLQKVIFIIYLLLKNALNLKKSMHL